MSFLRHYLSHHHSKNNHKEFWDRTKYNKHPGKKYDTLEPETSDNINHRNSFFYELTTMPIQNLPDHAMYSKVNPDLLVTSNEWVVSMVRKGDHGYIIVESIGFGNDVGLCMRWFDYLPKKEHPHAPNCCFGVFTNFNAVQNKQVDGVIRYCPTNNGRPLINMPIDMSKEELFKKIKWNQDSDSWQCSPDAAINMMKDIMNDFQLSEQKKIKFKFCGHRHSVNKESATDINDYTLNSDIASLNCISWAWSKLNKAEINAVNHRKLNKIVIRGSLNIGSKREACLKF